MHRLGRLIDRLTDVGGAISGLIIVLMALSVSFEIVMRTIFNMPTKWVLEYSTYSVIGAAYFGAAYVSKVNRHVVVDILTSRISDSTKAALDFVNHLWSLAFCAILVYTTAKTAIFSFNNEILVESILLTPLWIPQSVIPVGVILLTLQLLKETAVTGMQLKQPPTDGASSKKLSGSLVDRPFIILPVIIGLLAVGTILFFSGGSLRTVGIIIMLLSMLSTGTPIFLVLGIVGAGGLFLVFGDFSSLDGTAIVAYKSLSNFTLTCIPLFVMGAGIFNISGLTNKLFDICKAWLSYLPGNLALATIASCAVFACISGSSVATAATIGMAAIPVMISYRYDAKLACGSVAAGGTLGLLIPPSAMFILYGYLTGTSVGQMFIAGIFPGILLTFLFMFYTFMKCRNDARYKATVNVTWKQRFGTLKDGIAILFTPVLILGGIYTGLFTPTEAAAVAVIYSLIISLVYKKLTLRSLFTTLRDCTIGSTMVFMIIFGAAVFGYLITILQIPHGFTGWAINSALPPWGIIVVVMLLLLVLGMFLECIAIQLITIPIVFPAVMALGFSPVWFGIMYCLAMELALITPPVGLNLFVIEGMGGQKLETVIKGVAPYMLIMGIALVIIGLFEPLSTWLPSTMHK